MKKLLLGILPLLMLSQLHAGKGKLRVSADQKGAYVYVDGKKKAMIGEGFSSILLEEGEYTIKVAKKVSELYQVFATKQVFIGEESSVKITLKLNKYEPTPTYAQKLKLLDVPKLKRWVRKGNTVTDTKLGLMWQDNSKAKSVKKKWSSAKKYCKKLSMGGYSDWRLPSYEELLTIVDYDRYKPAIMPSFQNVVSKFYCSSSEDVSDGKDAWVVDFGNGNTYYGTKAYENYVRCVRARQ